MLRAKIFRSVEVCMAGVELRRLRIAAGLSQERLAVRMYNWGWYRQKVNEFESGKRCRIIFEGPRIFKAFSLPPNEMEALLDVLGASSI